MDMNIENQCKLMLSLAPEFSNFVPGFRGKLSNTLILSPYASDWFAIDVDQKDGAPLPVLAVPDELFSLMSNLAWKESCVIPGRPGLFLVFIGGRKWLSKRRGIEIDRQQPIALRIALRRKPTNALIELAKNNKGSELELRRIDASGLQLNSGGQKLDAFRMPLVSHDALYWEKT